MPKIYSPFLHYAGIIVAAVGFFIAIGSILAIGRAAGIAVSDYYGQAIIGIVLIIIGILMFCLINE